MTSANVLDGFLGFPRGTTVVVTGAASGIGRAVALVAAECGLAVAGWDVDDEGLATLDAELVAAGARALTVRADVGDESGVETALERTTAELGAVACLVNNAGPSSYGGLAFDEALAVAVGSVRRVTEAWLAQPGSQGGSVVNVASVAGPITGGGAAAWYPAAKAAITGYTRYLAVERPHGIRANAVAPGFTATPRTAAFLDSDAGRAAVARTPLRRAAAASEVARPILFLLSPAASYVNGALLPIDGGLVVVL
jgi:NAD(P)-dependent dehydrogenase (short-subunit alcohol dehydrogenase family)